MRAIYYILRVVACVRHVFTPKALIVFALLLTPFTAATSYAMSGEYQAPDGRLITFHDRGKEKVVLTHAGTIRDALGDAKITVVKEDIVQPGLDSQLVAEDYTVNIYRARPIIVVDGPAKLKVMTAEQTTEGIAKAADITLRDEDTADIHGSLDILADGASEVMTIDRATKLELQLYGSETSVYTQAKTVGEMLNEKDIALGRKDTLSVDRDTPITAGMKVAVWRDGITTTTVKETIDFPIRQIQDVDRPVGYKKIQTPGTDGSKKVTYQVTMKGGKIVKKVAIQTVILQRAKEQVEVVGAKPAFSGGFAEAMAKLRACESGGNYANKNNPSYRGAYQFGYQTWANNGGYYDPADAPPALQDAAARALYERRGWQPWPVCGANLPDIYR